MITRAKATEKEKEVAGKTRANKTIDKRNIFNNDFNMFSLIDNFGFFNWLFILNY